MNIKVIVKDLLTMPKEYVLAHNIDAGETAMGAGVAKALCNKYPTLRKSCVDFAVKNNHSVGLTHRFVDASGMVIYNMYTKAHVWHNSGRGMTKEEYCVNTEKCLTSLKNQMIANNEKFLAIPKIGCGLDRCLWQDIEPIIIKVFENTDIEIMVCML